MTTGVDGHTVRPSDDTGRAGVGEVVGDGAQGEADEVSDEEQGNEAYRAQPGCRPTVHGLDHNKRERQGQRRLFIYINILDYGTVP